MGGLRLARAVLALSMCVLAAAAHAQTFPDKPLKLLVGFAPGSTSDVSARIVTEAMAKLLGQPIIIEIRAGASSNIAADAAAKAEPDGYTLFMGSVANIINKAANLGSAIDLARDLKPVGLISEVPNILVVHPSLKATTVAELVALAKAEPGKLNYGSPGIGTSPHLSGELFNVMAGVKLVHVPYKGTAQAAQDVVGGSLQLMFAPASTVLGLIEGKQLRALAWTSLKRGPALPELPTVSEAGLNGFETAIWFGLHVPLATPDGVRAKLAAALAEATRSEAVAKAFRTQGIEPLTGGPQQYAAFIDKEAIKWGEVVSRAGLGR